MIRLKKGVNKTEFIISVIAAVTIFVMGIGLLSLHAQQNSNPTYLYHSKSIAIQFALNNRLRFGNNSNLSWNTRQELDYQISRDSLIIDLLAYIAYGDQKK